MISIIIPCYNHQDIVGRAVQSALQQNLEKEIIVVDDGSEPPLRNIWGNPVRVLRHPENKGLSNALNTGIFHSNYGKFVILAADDEMAPGYLQQAVVRDEAIVSCDMLVGGRHVKSVPGSLEALKKANCHSYCAVVKKDLWQRVGGFNSHMNPSQEDWEFWLNCAKHGATWYHLNKPMHIYHRNPTGRDAEAQGKDRLLDGKRQGFHTDLFGQGAGLVTVVIPCYDQEKYLEHSISTSLNQTYPHVNVVVVDDESPGNVFDAVSELNVDLSKIILARQENKHLSGARNTGIKIALEKFNSQYLIMLDADDGLEPNFIEETLAVMEDRNYVYTNVKFIGDAWHNYDLHAYSCQELANKHIHPCTFLAQSSMLKDVQAKRGFMYDEAMKEGYEDWEFAVACADAGWCGKHLPKYIFHYRQHTNGSMRTEATKINAKLVQYIQSKHPWMFRKELAMPCSSCGGSRYVKTTRVSGGTIMTSVNIPGVGELATTAPILVTYTGVTESTMTKLGQRGTVYKYSGNPKGTYGPEFTAYAVDAHLFAGPFRIKALDQQVAQEIVAQNVVPTAISKPVELQQKQPDVKPVEVVRTEPTFDTVQRMQEKMAAKEAKLDQLDVDEEDIGKPDDFAEILVKLPGVGKANAKKMAQKLVDAGFTFYEDVEDATAQELSTVLGIDEDKAEELRKAATKVLDL